MRKLIGSLLFLALTMPALPQTMVDEIVLNQGRDWQWSPDDLPPRLANKAPGKPKTKLTHNASRKERSAKGWVKKPLNQLSASC